MEDSIPKSEWGPGPWHDEPDRLEWVDEVTGYPCLMRRNTLVTGAWCGYVGVNRLHPAYDADYDTIKAEVHGGLTWGSVMEQPDGLIGYKKKKKMFWLGFDCSHYRDYSPALEAQLNKLIPGREPREGEIYRDALYVKNEVEQLALQIRALADA